MHLQGVISMTSVPTVDFGLDNVYKETVCVTILGGICGASVAWSVFTIPGTWERESSSVLIVDVSYSNQSVLRRNDSVLVGIVGGNLWLNAMPACAKKL